MEYVPSSGFNRKKKEQMEDIPEFDDFAEFINSNPEKYSENELPF